MADDLVHPTDKLLQAYGLGKLDGVTSESVSIHLESCAVCQSRVAEISSDSFLGRLRGAQGRQEESAMVQAHSPVSQTDRGPSVVTAAPPADTMPPGLADHSDYEVIKELGRGGMGVVYLAHNRLMGRNEVLKVMSRHIMERPGLLARFLAEIRAVARLQHPNIVTAYSAFRLGESILFAMEYVEGLDLAKMVKTKGPLPVAHASYFVSQAAQGMQHAHEQGMVHRDIKPGNLMLSHKGGRALIKILDFGLAKATREAPVDGGLTNPGQAMGTPHYMAPEQIRDAQKADIRADIYSLGCTLYYLLSGGPPFHAENLWDLYQAHHSMDAKLLNFVRPDVPGELAALVAKMMAKDPGRRFQTPSEVAHALGPFFKKASVNVRPLNPEISQVGLSENRPESPARRDTVSTQPAPGPAPAPMPAVKKPAAPAEPATRWESLIEFKETQPLRDPVPAIKKTVIQKPRWLWPAAAGGLLLMGLIVAWAAVVLRVKTSNGTIVASRSAPTDSNATPRRTDESPSAAIDRARFKILSGRWTSNGAELIQADSTRWYNEILFGDDQWTDYDFVVDAMRVGGDSSFSLFFRNTQPGNEFDFTIAGDGNKTCSLQARERPLSSTLKSYDFSLRDGAWYTARVHVRGNHLVCSIYDNHNATETRVFDVYDDRHARGRVGLQTFGAAFRFKNIKVTASDGSVLWEGPPAVDSTAPAEFSRPAEQARASVKGQDGFVQLFNGIDLTGWKTHPQQPGNWRVENGILIGSGAATSHLYTDRDDYKDFHLRVDALINDGGNSGVYFRAPFGPTFPANNPQWLAAYNAKIDKNRFGGLIVDGAFGRPVIRNQIPVFQPGQWITLEVIVQGNRIQIKVNGAKTVDHTDPQRHYSRGHIVLQQHGSRTVVKFWKIEIKELPSSPAE